jgi:DNA invertase Pin-like site-specific DNA recombinase
MKAATYARKSTEDATAASVTRQAEDARAFAERRRWTVAEEHVFVDDGVSGAEFQNRPGLLRLLVAARSKPRPFDAVVMAEASRLGRDRLRTEIVARDLHEAGVTLWYYGTGEQERLDTPEGRFVLAARSFAAELERGKAKERCRDAHASRARKGYVTGGVVYGYRNVPVFSGTDSIGIPVRSYVRREIEPGEAEILRGIFRAFADGLGRRSIARALNGDPSLEEASRRYFGGRRIPSPRKSSRSWAPSAIGAMLDRGLYRGIVRWGRYRNVDREGRTRQREKQPDESIIVREEPELRIIDQVLWEAVEARRKGTGHRGGGVPKKQAASLLSGLSACDSCGGPVVIVGSRKRTRCYGCGWRVNRGATVCANALLASAPAIDRAFLGKLEETVFTDTARRQLFDRAREMLAAANATASTDERRVRHEIRRLEATISALVRAIENAALSGGVPDALVTRLRELEAEKQRAELRLREILALRAVTHLELRRDEQELARRLRDLRSEMLSDINGARAVVSRLLVGKVVFEPAAEDRAYLVRATLAPGRVISTSSPTGFEPDA